jgi:formylmethanofuran dehydrogenase subunit B
MYTEIRLSTNTETTYTGIECEGKLYRTEEYVVLTPEDVADSLETADEDTLYRIKYALGLLDRS